MIAAPIVEALANVKAELEVEGKLETYLENSKLIAKEIANRDSRDFVHKYKITHTETIEIDDSEKAQKVDLLEAKAEAEKHRKVGCFGRCFGKKS